MSSNGNGMHYVVIGEKQDPMDDTGMSRVVEVMNKPKKDRESDWKIISIVVGLFLTFGGLVWTGATVVANKANTVDVANLDKTLTELRIVIERMNEQILEIKEDIKELK